MNKKKTLSFFLVILIIISSTPVGILSAFAQNGILVYAENLSCESETTITVPVKIKNNTGIKSTAIYLRYDTNCFEVNDVYAGELFENGNFNSDFGGVNFVEGDFKVGWSDSDIISDDGILFYVEFNVSKSANGSNEITITCDESETRDKDYNIIDNFEATEFKVNVDVKNIEYEKTTRFKLSDATIKAGDEFDIDINVENINNLDSIELNMNYEKKNFTFLSYTSNENLIVNITNNSGRLSIIINGLSNLDGKNNVSTLKFKSNENTSKGTYSFKTTYKNAVGNKLINITYSNVTAQLSGEYDYGIIYSDDLYSNYLEEIVVPIKIKHNIGIQAYKLLFDYEKTDLQFLKVTSGAFPSKPNLSNVIDGHFCCTWAAVDNVYLNDVVLNIHFLVLTQEKDKLSKINVDYVPEETCDENNKFVTLDCSDDVNIILNHIPVVTTLILKSKPSKLTYELFEEFDASGMVIEATKDDGSVEIVTDYTVTGFETNSVGTKTITVSYEGYSVSFDVEVAHTHTWGEWQTVSSPNCLDKGSEKRVCSVCKEPEMRDVDPLGHNWEKDFTVDIEPKCEIAGTKSIHCSRCDVMKDVTSIEPIGHNYDSTITKAATCTEDGIKTFVCKNDPSHTYTEPIEKLGHNYVPSVTKQPTCEEKGIKTFVCSNDSNHTYTEDINPIGHSFELTKTIKATCTEDGKEIYTCKNDSSHTKEVVLKATGHSPSDWIIDKTPTYLEDGSRHKECTFCKTVLSTESISMLDDITAPEVEIKVKDNSFKSFINDISFGLFFKETVDITITAQDAESGVEKVEYIKTNTPISKSDIALQTEWISGDSLTVSEDEEFIIYVKATDKQGNISYAGTDGLVVDKTAPVINGITDNAVYCQPVSFTVSDKYIEKVIVNGTEALSDSGEYTLPSAESPYEIVAVDKAGNETVYNVTVNNGHTYGAWVVDKSADCTNNGEKHRICSICGYEYNAVISALGHNYSESFTIDIEPTCTAAGEKSKHCSRCDDRKDITIVDALGHSFGEWKTIVSPDCTNSGSKQRVCTVCGFIETENLNPNGHNWNKDFTIDIPATCTDDGSKSIHCSNCDAVKDSQAIPATGHNLGKYKVIESATCTESGLEKRNCENCEYSETREIPALGHDYSTEFTVDNDATCTENGEKSKHCSRCDSKADVTIIALAGHNYGDWTVVTAPTCTEKGTQQRVCTVCGVTEIENLNPNGHNWNKDFTIDIPATCTDDGSKSIHCTICDAVKDSQVIPAIGHSFGEYKVIESATCTESGLEKSACSNCEYSETREIPALGHDYSTEFTVDKDATCTENGEKSKHCSRCDSKADVTIIAPAGHNYGDWTVVTASTCTEKGTHQRVCTVCANVETQEIVANGHSWNNDYTVDVEAGCTTEGSKSIHCANCNETKDTVAIPPAGHRGGTANCHSGAICEACGAEYGEIDLSNHDGNTEIKGYIAPTVNDFGYTGDTYCKSCGAMLESGTQIEKLPPETTVPTKPVDTTNPTDNPTDKTESTEKPTDNKETTAQKSETTTANSSDIVNKNTSKTSPATGNMIALPVALSTAFAFGLICIAKKKKED